MELVALWAQKDIVLRVTEFDAGNETRGVSVTVGIFIVGAIIRASIPGIGLDLETLPVGLTLFFKGVKQIKRSVPVWARDNTRNSRNIRVFRIHYERPRQVDKVVIPPLLVNEKAIAFDGIINYIFSGSLDLLLERVRKSGLVVIAKRRDPGCVSALLLTSLMVCQGLMSHSIISRILQNVAGALTSAICSTPYGAARSLRNGAYSL